MKKITLSAALVLLITVLAGCDIAVAGARCKAGAAPARDATHVLVCTKGRWTRSITLGQAAEIMLRNVPGSLRITSVVPATAPVDQPIDLAVRVESLTGAKVANRTVVVTGPGVVGTPTAVTDGDGMAWFRFDHATVPGSYTDTVAVKDTNLTATFDVVRTPGAPVNVEKVSGDGQTVPSGTTVAAMTARVTDKFGNPAVGRTVFTRMTGTSGSQVTVGAGGLVVLGPMTIDAAVGPFTFSVRPRETDDLGLVVFTHTVTLGAPHFVSVTGPAPAPRNLTFASPVSACLTDSGHNAIAGSTFTFTVVPGSTGASGALSVPTAVGASDGCATVDVTAGAQPGSWTLRATAAGVVGAVGLTNL